jgi:transposase
MLSRDLFENPNPSPLGGRPRVGARKCLEGVLWVLITGAHWKFLPERNPSSTTCWRRHKLWMETGVLVAAWKRLLDHMDHRGLLHWNQAAGDGTFSPAKKGAPMLVSRSVARV